VNHLRFVETFMASMVEAFGHQSVTTPRRITTDYNP